MYLEEGKPLVFGKQKNMGLKIEQLKMQRSEWSPEDEAPADLHVHDPQLEGIAVATAAAIDVGAGYRDKALSMMRAGSTHLPSMAEDVLVGRSTEITQLNVQVARRGRAPGIATPTHDAVIDLIKTFDWRLGLSVPVGGPKD